MIDLETPTVQVFFNGLLVLKLERDGRAPTELRRYCQVGIHRRSVEHVLTITVRQKRAGYPDVNLWRYSGHLTDNLWIDVANLDRGVNTCTYGASFDRCRTDLPPQPPELTCDIHRDIRWAVNPESCEFHNRPLQRDADGLNPSVYLTKGTFYTAMKSSPIGLTREGGGKDDFQLCQIATIIGAAIQYEKEKGYVFLQWGRQDRPFLVLPKMEGLTYEIYLDNSEPIARKSPPEETRLRTDFYKYYEVFRNIPPGERFEIFRTGPFSPDVPCMSLFLGIP